MIIKRKLKYKELPYSQELINRYKSRENMLSHARYIPGKTDGVFLVDQRNNNQLVGYIGWEGDTIIALEVSEDYRKQGVGTYLLKKAVENGITNLTVAKNNTEAINLYKSLGWEVYKETPKIYFMKYGGEETVILYHVTKKENVPSILREGLKGSKATEDSNTLSMQTGIPKQFLKNKLYLLRNLDLIGGKLPFKSSYRKLLKIEVPMREFKTWEDVRDPIRTYFKNKKDWIKFYLSKNSSGEHVREIAEEMWNNTDPRKIMVINKDIPPKYISVL